MDDIAGWDFFDDDNDPAGHVQLLRRREPRHAAAPTEAVERGNDGQGSIGVCPKCQFVPMRVWDTFVSDQNNFFLAVTYAADNGVKVILGADGGLYHSAFAEKASRYAYEKGVAQIYSGDDLNTGNHNYPAAYNHAMLVAGRVGRRRGARGGAARPRRERPGRHPRPLIAPAERPRRRHHAAGADVLPQAPTPPSSAASRRSRCTGPTGSTNTGKAAGAAALIMSAALKSGIDAVARTSCASLLERPPRTSCTADTVGTGIPDPAQQGFDTHFGYGRVDVGKAAAEAAAGRIPPRGVDRLARLVRAAAGGSVPA